MGRKWLLSLVCLSLFVVLFIPVSDARVDIKINEAATTISFQQQAPIVSLAVENGLNKTLRAIVRVELLKPSGEAVGTVEEHLAIGKGKQKLVLTLPLKSRGVIGYDNQILWHRLHYTLVPDTSGEKLAPIEGLISLSQITTEFFQLRVTSAGAARPGVNYRVRVQALQPLSQRAAPGVRLRGTVTLSDTRSDTDTVLTDFDWTNKEGYGDLTFKLPASTAGYNLTLSIEGTRGLFTVKVEKEIDVLSHPAILISTDKPLYQPGQTVHSRAMVLSSFKRAISSKPATVKVTDPEDTVIYNAESTTSRFGIASVDWTIPDNVRLGDYTLQFRVDDEWANSVTIQISRYDLPNFVVNVKTDRPFYLAGQNARITVRGDYLFGEVVPRGRVRIVRDTERTWNYHLQKYETTEGEQYEGQLGTDGSFSLELDLAKDFRELQKEEYSRYTDLRYAAYLTDPTTNRTEQRLFNVRLSNQPIHVYVIRPGDPYYENVELRPTFYVTTFYPDGTPAECKLSVTVVHPSNETDNRRRTLASGRTSRFGIAKIEEVPIPRELIDKRSITFTFLALDKEGRVGTLSESIRFEDEPAIRVRTPKTVYSKGEPIQFTVVSTKPSETVTVEVVRDWSILHAQRVRTQNGTASIRLPYRSEFKDEIILAAYVDRGPETQIMGTRSIIYPRSRDLKLNLQATSKTYKPGEDTRFIFKSATAKGRPVESALGVVVVDKAVEERFRSAQENPWRYATFYDEILRTVGYGDGIGPVSRKTIDNLDMSRPISPALDLAAEVLLNRYRNYFPRLFESDDYEKNFRELFSKSILSQFHVIRDALIRIYERTRTYPTNESVLNRLLASAGVTFSSLKDPWGTPYRSHFYIEGGNDVFLLKSAGPDETFDTDDDFSGGRLTWSYFRQVGEAIDKVARSFHQRTGEFILNLNTLREELRREGIDLDLVRDPWSKPYIFKFEVAGTNFIINSIVKLPAEAGTNQEPAELSIWQTKIDYFQETRRRIDGVLHAGLSRSNEFPRNPTTLTNALKLAGIDLESLRDPWGNPYYNTFSTLSFRGDQIRIESRSESNNSPKQQLESTPVTTVVLTLKFRSAGMDGKEGTEDDFDVASFATTSSLQSAGDLKPRQPQVLTTFQGSTGALTGLVTDPNGAAIAGAAVTANQLGSKGSFIVNTDDEGRYLLRNLTPGVYELRIEAPGFKALVITHIQVRFHEVLEFNAVLEVGAPVETVQVTSDSEPVQTVNSSLSSVIKAQQVLSLKVDPQNKRPLMLANLQQISTPRLREFFPETLVWKPELTTDKRGRALLDFKLADNITTWKMSVIGSTEAGEVGVAETEIRAFQPFFAELDSPKILTQGDRISLPVVLRNYLDRKQTIDLHLQPEKWFKILDSDRRRTDVPQGDSVTQSFNLEALESIEDGRQRISALGPEFSDAIQKSVTVHPDGEEKSTTTSEILRPSTEMFVDLPPETINNSARVELKIYPNLTSHVWESVEGIMRRPYGCGEQTISSTYPSLLVCVI